MQKEQAEERRKDDAIKLALLTHDPRNGAVLFPSVIQPMRAKTDSEIEEALSGGGPVVIESMPKEEIEAVLSRIGSGGQITAEDIASSLIGSV